ncbi:MAG: adenosine deaminase, partial [Acidobacteria bacterium]|nr:adenosine deaminase [Acidobacteriota bacterium]
GLHVTVHAGEAAGPASIREALSVLGAERIGHGVRVAGDAPLEGMLRDRAIALEMCPRSNVQTRAVPRIADHPITQLLTRGLRVTVSTDGRTVSNTTVTSEFDLLHLELGWGLDEFRACQQHAAAAAFASDHVRADLMSQIGGS